MRRALFATALETTVASMASGNTDGLQSKGRLSMRATIGIAIALPVAAIFCLAYLTMLALEAFRDAARAAT
jgi:hypothetical protein